ncbi:DUF1080 domain-containing protein [Roseimicrobium sp. ORNL1]|uniref:3-keto-disaccharide hydrolase n=1 Tax=Roseimicrobium sp. ORNL1 TaxID=2711231 RepID=UPI0013E12F02|nr:DUF1080 domain-containing protein [Roseimicrobium sp. ORNL1]QIF03492.1 DUF1080 domain-containing protein [Roseimicrobium sp. ORNL1]
MKIQFPAALLLTVAFTAVACHGQEKDKPSPIGYEDTPIIPGTEWRVHDIKRPAPPVVKPGKTNDDAPADAVIIFNGGSTDALVSKEGKPCPWKVENGELLIAGGDCWTKEQFGSCQLHIEWMSAPNTKGNSQKKGNAGVFFMDRYESQMMDNDNNPTYADGMTGSIYGQTPPLANAVRKSGEWQTYDIIFTAPTLKDGKVVEPAYVTTFVNGVCVQVHTKIMGPTKHKNITNYDGDFPEKAPIRLQDHKNDPPVRVRNYWVRPLP